MKARRQIVDPLTGTAVRHDSPVAVDTGNVVVGRNTIVSDDDRDPTRDRFGITPSAEPALREAIAEEKRAAQERAPRGRGPQIKVTMESPEAGVREFERLNPTMFHGEAAVDMKDRTRDFLDGIEVRSGSRYVRANRSKRGKEILQKSGTALVRATLGFLFGQSRSRRWSDVPWQAVTNYLEEVNAERADEGMPIAPITYPIAAGLDAPDVQINRIREEMGPEAAARAIRAMTSEELRRLATRMERAIETSGEECMSGDALRAAKERVKTMRRWSRHPELVPDWSCVGTEETEGAECSFPALLEDIRRIENSCAVGYEPLWPLERAERACDTGEPADRTGVIGEPCKVAQTAKTAPKKRLVRIGPRVFWI